MLHPDIFQGNNKKHRYFEGWYFKIIDSKTDHAFAVIPGISLGEWDSHAFIQVLDTDNKVNYFRFNLNDFEFNENKFEIMIGENYFSKTRMRLNLKGQDVNIQGDLYFRNIMEYPKTALCRGVMGPFLYIPNMECYHDIINIQHDVIGHLKIAGKLVDFTGGIGYIEKNWGRSMPNSWIWVQSNHFQPDDVSISLNIGKVNCLGTSFTGFIALFRHRDRIFLFTTYNGARITRLHNENNRLVVTIKDCRFRLEVIVTHATGGEIKAPVNGRMSRNVTESINGVVHLRFSDVTGRVFYEGIGTNTGLEIVE
jgi:hypothetical protein